MGFGWGMPTAEEAWDELRSLSPMHAGMSYERLEALGGIQWPCPDNDHPGTLFLHGWLWEDPMPREPAALHPGRMGATDRRAERRLSHAFDDRAAARWL